MKATLEIAIDPKRFPLRAHRMRQFGLNHHSCVEMLPDGTRRTLRARCDTQPNSPEGVRYYYLLESGHVYEVTAPVQRGGNNHYYCTVSAIGDIILMPETDVEVATWLQQQRSSAHSG